MSDLLFCPFCGGEAETLTAESMYGGYLFGIMCNDCRSRGDVYGTEDEAIAAWNRRVGRTCKMEPTFINPQAFENVQEFTCTACGRFAIVEQLGDDEDRPTYCPNCGARRVGE